MKKKKLNLLQWFVPLCALLVFALISCKDDDLTESSDPPGTDEPIGYATGGVITTEADWEGIPVLTDVSQLNLGEPQGSQKNLYASKLIDNELPPLFNQGKYGTCTSSSVAYGVAMLTRKLSGMKYANSALHAPNDSARTFSVAFLHGTSHRKKETPTPVDKIPTTGLHIPEVLRTLREDGVPTYPDYRYTKHNIINVPDQKIKDKAHFNSSNIFRIINEGQQTLTQIREIIDRDGVVFFSMLIPINPDVPHLRNGKQIIGYQELINDESPARVNAIINGAVTQEAISKKAYSGHTMTIVDYDNDKQAFLVLNSWGEGFGGTDGAPKGCFWLKYNVFGRYYTDEAYYINRINNIIYDIATLGLREDAKITGASLLYEYTGYGKYSNVVYSNDNSFNYGTVNGNETPYVTINEKDYIEYPKGTIIPSSGTIEFEVLVEKAYREDYPIPMGDYDNALIFSTLIENQSESRVSGALSPIGGMQLKVSNDGHILLRYAYDTFDSTLSNKDLMLTLLNTKSAHIYNTDFKFNKFNKIAISYDADGIRVKVNKADAVKVYDKNAIMAGNANFKIGYSLTRNDVWDREICDQYAGCFWQHGTNKKSYEGFIGKLRAFRTSVFQNDWVITK